jgi:hypothetical protein
MKHLYAAANLIEAAGLAEIGLSLFVGTSPADAHVAIELRDPLYGAEIDPAMGGFLKHDFQIIVRHSDPAAAWDLAQSAAEALIAENLQSEGCVIRKMYPLQLPVTYPKMESDEMETSVRIRVWYALVKSA